MSAGGVGHFLHPLRAWRRGASDVSGCAGVVERYGKSAHVLTANGPSRGQGTEYPLIHLLDLRRRGWQVQSASRQESAGKSSGSSFSGLHTASVPTYRWSSFSGGPAVPVRSHSRIAFINASAGSA